MPPFSFQTSTMLELSFHPKLYETRLLQSHINFHVQSQARKELRTANEPAELTKNPIPLARLFDLAPDQYVLDWQYYNELPLKIDFTILSSKQQDYNDPKYMKYLALSIHIPSFLFRGTHEDFNLRPWPENCVYNLGHSQQELPPKGNLWQVFQICSSPGSNPPQHLDTLSLEVQIESFKYTKFVAGIQKSGPQLFHPDENGFITDSAAPNFPINMAVK